MLLEYLKALKTLKILNVLTILKSLNSLKPGFKTVTVGRIEIRSTIAQGVKGYLTKAVAERSSSL